MHDSAPRPAHDRIRVISHKGKNIIFIDYSGCSPAVAEQMLKEVPDIVAAYPLRSALLFADFTDASFSSEALSAMKEAAVFDKPYVKKAAWVGADIFPPEFVETLKTYSAREFPTFDTRQQALDWLVKE
jgi:hypothetical protein